MLPNTTLQSTSGARLLRSSAGAFTRRSRLSVEPLGRLMNESLTSEKDIVTSCERALRLAPEAYPPTLPASQELLGAPEWYRFEHKAWPIGEAVRQAFSQNPKFKKNQELISKVLEVATCRNLRRGRQSFIMALEFVGARQHAGAIARFLDDPDVDGQVVGTLLKMKAGGFAKEMQPLLSAKHSWIRRLAQRYIERYPDAAS